MLGRFDRPSTVCKVKAGPDFALHAWGIWRNARATDQYAGRESPEPAS